MRLFFSTPCSLLMRNAAKPSTCLRHFTFALALTCAAVASLGVEVPEAARQAPSDACPTTSEGRQLTDSRSEAKSRLAAYRSELDLMRGEFSGSDRVPEERFFLFGMGLRSKFIYKAGKLSSALDGKELESWKVQEEWIIPSDYRVILALHDGKVVSIEEDASGVWICEAAGRRRVAGTEAPVNLPDFASYRFPRILRVLHHELLFNVTAAGPVPNIFVYKKPWYRDAAMMALAFKETENVAVIRDWILNLREAYDRNNAGETEADNLGQALYLISLVSDQKHPLVATVLAEIPKFERTEEGARFILGRSDFAEHPVYQTKWLKYGLRALGLPDPYTAPKRKDTYSALFWMDYKDAYVPGDQADRGDYPYLGWACDHFHGEKKSPISNRDYPLTWEAKASQADYAGLRGLSEAYAEQKISAPHTWHAAEVFLYLLEQKAQ